MVIQRIKVGDAGAGVMFLAASNWRDDTAFTRAREVLNALKDAGTDFDSVGAIVARVNEDAQVIAAVAAAAERARVVGTVDGGVAVKVSDIMGGTWQQIPGANRTDRDYELLVRLDGTNYSLHVHAGNFAGRNPIPGAVMKAGRALLTDTPQDICNEIIRIKGRPAGW